MYVNSDIFIVQGFEAESRGDSSSGYSSKEDG